MTLYLPNHDVYARFLAYEPDIGRGFELDRAAVPVNQQAVRTGAYVNIGASVAGFFRARPYPMFFLDARRISLDDTVRAAVTKGERTNELVLTSGETRLLSMRYTPPPMHYDNWSDDETFVDLFQWLAQQLAMPGFRELYTS
jgi:hypothetical protein